MSAYDPKRTCANRCALSSRSRAIVLTPALFGLALSRPADMIFREGQPFAIAPRGGGSMSFEFGVFHEFPRYAGVTDTEVFTQSFAQVDAPERWGLDVIWIAELHFLPERSVAS